MKEEEKKACSKGTCAPIPINTKEGILVLILLLFLIILLVLKGSKII